MKKKMNVKLTRNGHNGDCFLVKWNNVQFAKATQSAYGDDYVEVHFGDQYVDVKETLEEIENLTSGLN